MSSKRPSRKGDNRNNLLSERKLERPHKGEREGKREKRIKERELKRDMD